MFKLWQMFFVRGIDSVLLEPKHLVVAAFLGAMVSDNVQLSKLEVFRLDYMQDQASVDKRFDCRILMSRVANVLLPDNAQTAGLWFEIHSRDTLSRYTLKTDTTHSRDTLSRYTLEMHSRDALSRSTLEKHSLSLSYLCSCGLHAPPPLVQWARSQGDARPHGIGRHRLARMTCRHPHGTLYTLPSTSRLEQGVGPFPRAAAPDLFHAQL